MKIFGVIWAVIAAPCTLIAAPIGYLCAAIQMGYLCGYHDYLNSIKKLKH